MEAFCVSQFVAGPPPRKFPLISVTELILNTFLGFVISFVVAMHPVWTSDCMTQLFSNEYTVMQLIFILQNRLRMNYVPLDQSAAYILGLFQKKDSVSLPFLGK